MSSQSQSCPRLLAHFFLLQFKLLPGGWPVLLDRLAPRPRWRLVVAPGTTKAAAAAAASTATQSRPPNPPRVRAEAALVVGTAIKNIDSFRNWVLESTVVDVPAEDESAVAETIAAVDRASQKKEYHSSEVPANITAVSALVGLLGGDSGTPTAAQLLLLRRRGVYALGAALRNNPVAQVIRVQNSFCTTYIWRRKNNSSFKCCSFSLLANIF